MTPRNTATREPHRTKVTLACENCRKRRIKCSGIQPCKNCADSGRACAFDGKNRSRRGPRPRKIGSQARQKTPALVPRPESQAWVPESSLSDDSDDDESDDDFGAQTVQWQPMLKELFFSRGHTADTTLVESDLDLVCHLMELFYTRASMQLRALLTPAQLHEQLVQRRLSQCLVLAMCCCSLRFSVHTAVRGQRGRSVAQTLAQEARARIGASSCPWQQLDSVRTLCILADYEAGCRRGRRAWMDIALGRSLVQLAKATDRHLLLPDDAAVLSKAELHLDTMQVLHSLGHANLEPVLSEPASLANHLPSSAAAHRSLHLVQVLARVVKLVSSPLAPPCTRDSHFQRLQDELDQHLVQHTSTFGLEYFARPESLHAFMPSLIWHCCAIVLNRVFLPVSNGCGAYAQSLDYPHAPPLFVKERVRRCDASANAVSNLARQIISRGLLSAHPQLLAFVCMQAALVFLNRLQRPVASEKRGAIVEKLQVTLMVLRAVGTWHAPAQDWINLLLQASHPEPAMASPVESMFDTYFSRFSNIREAPFVPLDTDPAHATSHSQQSQGTYSSGDDSSAPIMDVSKSPSTWTEAYAAHLYTDVETKVETDMQDDAAASAHQVEPIDEAASTANHSEDTRRDDQDTGRADAVAQSSTTMPWSRHDESPPTSQLIDANDMMGQDLWISADGPAFLSALFDQLPAFDDYSQLSLGMTMLDDLGEAL
ncbi:hypothetical protein CDD81_7580 [Ophiocordyceps australis]|uniref:Zn(2)-C6 fungal-type domain-containing protein n=1 Tax=Ophiocordyceps australis TaxID=1399860 RepID=A0A2C5Y077_9HYPO|nr:hypothetical protein CDD81_7580 [Ophiocordyceps australis]